MLASDLNNPECLRGTNLTWMLSSHSDPSKIADTLMIDEFYASFKDAGFFFFVFFQSIILEGGNQKELRIKRNMKSLPEPGVQPSWICTDTAFHEEINREAVKEARYHMFYLVNISHRRVTLKTMPWKVTCLAVNHFPTFERQRLGSKAPIYVSVYLKTCHSNTFLKML